MHVNVCILNWCIRRTHYLDTLRMMLGVVNSFSSCALSVRCSVRLEAPGHVDHRMTCSPCSMTTFVQNYYYYYHYYNYSTTFQNLYEILPRFTDDF